MPRRNLSNLKTDWLSDSNKMYNLYFQSQKISSKCLWNAFMILSPWSMNFTSWDLKAVFQCLPILTLQFKLFTVFHLISCVMYSQRLLPVVEMNFYTDALQSLYSSSVVTAVPTDCLELWWWFTHRCCTRAPCCFLCAESISMAEMWVLSNSCGIRRI